MVCLGGLLPRACCVDCELPHPDSMFCGCFHLLAVLTAGSKRLAARAARAVPVRRFVEWISAARRLSVTAVGAVDEDGGARFPANRSRICTRDMVHARTALSMLHSAMKNRQVGLGIGTG